MFERQNCTDAKVTARNKMMSFLSGLSFTANIYSAVTIKIDISMYILAIRLFFVVEINGNKSDIRIADEITGTDRLFSGALKDKKGTIIRTAHGMS